MMELQLGFDVPLESWTIYGTPADCVETLARGRAMGLDGVGLTIYSLPREARARIEYLQMIAEEILRPAGALPRERPRPEHRDARHRRRRPPAPRADSLLVENGRIAAIGDGLDRPADVVIDARGTTVMPGLIDSHSHPTFGDYTPAQDALGWITHYCHGGVTTLVSAGELHLPGLPIPPDAPTALALAHLAKRCWDNLRPCGVKVRAGTLLLVPGLTEADFDGLAAAGIRLVKFIFYDYARLARRRGRALRRLGAGPGNPGEAPLGRRLALGGEPGRRRRHRPAAAPRRRRPRQRRADPDARAGRRGGRRRHRLRARGLQLGQPADGPEPDAGGAGARRVRAGPRRHRHAGRHRRPPPRDAARDRLPGGRRRGAAGGGRRDGHRQRGPRPRPRRRRPGGRTAGRPGGPRPRARLGGDRRAGRLRPGRPARHLHRAHRRGAAGRGPQPADAAARAPCGGLGPPRERAG